MSGQDTAVASAARNRSSIALSTRLLVAFTLASFATLALAMQYIDRAVGRGLLQVHQDMLGDHLAALRLSIDNNDGDLHAAEMLLQHTIGGDKNEKSFARLADASGQTLFQTPGFEEYSPPSSAFPAPAPVGQVDVPLVLVHSRAGRPILVACALIARSGSPAPMTYCFVADALPEQQFVNTFRLELGMVLLTGTLLSAGLAWIISHRGLRPVAQITAEIEQTTAKALQQPDATEELVTGNARWPREIARLAAAFAALRGRLGRSFHQLRQFSDDAAHEIRTPLNNMMGVASLTLQRERSAEEYRAALISTLEECDYLKKVADGLLFISRAEHHRSALALGSFDVHDAIAEVVDYYSEIAQDQNVTIKVQAQGRMIADRTLFRQALTNLLNNALRHTPTGGMVEIGFDTSGDDPSGTATLTVADTGEGIAPDHLPHIFDRFYRVDTARTHGGAQTRTGLGLAIVKAIAELHGGNITAESEPGRGTKFTMVWGRS